MRRVVHRSRWVLGVALPAALVFQSVTPASAATGLQIRSAINDPGAPGSQPGAWTTDPSGTSYELPTSEPVTLPFRSVPDDDDGASYVEYEAPARPNPVAGLPIAAEVRGTIAYNTAGDVADAFCSQWRSHPLAPARWEAHRWPDPTDPGRDGLGVMLRSADGTLAPLAWTPDRPFPAGSAAGDAACSENHVYVAPLPAATMPCSGDAGRKCYRFEFKDGVIAADRANSTLEVRVEYARAVVSGNSTANYRCSKHINDPFGVSLQPTWLADGKLVVDTRRQSLGAEPSDPTRPYYEATGHDGVFTCNWIERGKRYRVTVSGMYKWDQSAPPGHALADAWCATGWPEGPPEDRDFYVSHWGRWIFGTYYGPAGADLSQLEPYGDGWRPKRFDFTSVVGTYYNPLSARIDNRFVSWQAANPDANGCDPSHTYTYEFTAGVPGSPTSGNGPLLLNLYDLWAYSEWDNCGKVGFRVQQLDGTGRPVGTPYDAPSASSPGGGGCGWRMHDQASDLRLIDDASEDPENADNYHKQPFRCEKATFHPGQASLPSCFWPIDVTAVGGNGPGGAKSVLRWASDSAVPHTVTSWCRPLAENDVPNVAADPSCAGTLFDSHPGCAELSPPASVPTTGCMNKGDVFVCDFAVAAAGGAGLKCWGTGSPVRTEAIPASLRNADLAEAERGQFQIPYFCRVDAKMRGSIVVSASEDWIAS